MQNLLHDFRYGLRSLWAKPAVTLVAMITIGLGIGASTAVFSVINAIVLKPLPYKDGKRLVAVWGKLLNVDQVELSPAEFADLRERNQSLAQFAASERTNLNLAGNGDPVRLEAQAVTASLFPLLGVMPSLGRTFTPEEDNANARVAVLSYGLWQRRFGGTREVVGRTMVLDGKNYEVIGVMPDSFEFPPPVAAASHPRGEIWLPRSLETESNRDSHNLFTIGQLKPGATVAQARDEMQSIARLREQEVRSREGTGSIWSRSRHRLVGN